MRNFILTLLAITAAAFSAQSPMNTYMRPAQGRTTIIVIDTADAEGLIHDSLDAAVRSGTQAGSFSELTIPGDGPFTALSVTGSAFNVAVPSEFGSTVLMEDTARVEGNLVLSALTNKSCLGTNGLGRVIEGSCVTAAAVSDSLDSAVRSGNGDIDVNNARVRGTGDVDGQFRAGSLTGPDYAFKVNPGDHEISTDQTIFVKIDGSMEIGKNGVGDYGVYIDTTMIQAAVTGDFLAALNGHGIFNAGDLGLGGYIMNVDTTDISFNVNVLATSYINGNTYIGDIGAARKALTILTDGTMSVNESVTPDFFGGLNVHGVLAVGGGDWNPIVVDPSNGGDRSGIFGGGYNGNGELDSLNYGYISVVDGAPGPGQGHTRLFSALHHVDGFLEQIDIQPVEGDNALGVTNLYGASVVVGSLVGSGNRYVCVDAGGTFFAAAIACP